MDEKKYELEIGAWEYQALLDNRMIFTMFKDALRTPKKSGDFVTLRMSRYTLNELAGFTAAEANHAKTSEEEELLGSAYESMEAALSMIARGD